MTLELLAVGDMHLGRHPSRLPGALAERGDALGPTAAWRRVVAAAIEARVDAVVLAGDVVEREDDFFEGYRELARGVAQLTEAGIRVLGIAGNHDVRVLPRLADQIPAFELIGRDGEWESLVIEAGGEQVTLWGWSFPREQVRSSPLEGAAFDRGPDPNLGLLHCDRDQAGSPYAPVTSAELDRAALDGWLLGHIHMPDALEAPRPSGYLGSVTGMDPGEHGVRGPWLVTVERGRMVGVSQWVLAPLRWERLDLDLTGLEAPYQAQDRLLERVRALDAELGELDQAPEAVGLRVRLVGQTNLGEQAAEQFDEETREQVFVGGRDTHYFIEKVVAETRPEIPLEELAGRDDPAGLLAQRLRLLDASAEDEARRRLIDEGRRRLQARLGEPRWQRLRREKLDEAEVVEYLRRAGTRMLERMLAQGEELH